MSDSNSFPPDAVYGRFKPNGPGPVSAENFERWPQDEDNPTELINGCVLPDDRPRPAERLAALLAAHLKRALGHSRWRVLLRDPHRLPHPASTEFTPDVSVHAAEAVGRALGTGPILRVPDLIIAVLDSRSRDTASPPHGAISSPAK